MNKGNNLQDIIYGVAIFIMFGVIIFGLVISVIHG